MRSTALAFGLALCVGPLRAQAAPLTLDSLYATMAGIDPRLRVAEARAVAARARIGPARRWPDPSIQFALMNRELPRLGLSDPLGMNQVQLMQMVPTAGKTGLGARAARAGADAEAERAREAALALRADAAMRFFDYYQAEQGIAVMAEGRQLLVEALRAGEALYAAGEGPQGAVLRAQVELSRMDEDLLRMRAMQAGMGAELNALRGLPLAAPVGPVILPALPDTLPPLDALEAMALDRRPMLAAGARDAEASAYLARRAAREIWPDLTLGVSYGQRPMPDGGTDRMASFMLGFTLPLTPGSRQRAMRDEAAAMHAMAIADLDVMRLTTRTRVAALHAEFTRAALTRRHYETTLLPQLTAACAAAQAAYRGGAGDLMTLLEAEMARIAARREVVRLDAERGKALGELEMLTTTRFFLDPSSVPAGETP